MIGVKSSGDFGKTRAFLDRLIHHDMYKDMNKYGQMGVEALSKATPKETGLTANSWSFHVYAGKDRTAIRWFNTNVDEVGTPIVILLQYGHGTRRGGYVQGDDFINPAMRPVFRKIAADVREKVIKR